MFILDHVALASNKPTIYDRDYVQFYLTQQNEKAFVSNEVWEALRFRIYEANKNNPDKEMADKIIAGLRGFAGPETMRFEEDHTETPPKRDYTEAELIASTKDLIRRNKYQVSYFVCGDLATYPEEDFSSYCFMNLDKFYAHCMGISGLRAEYEVVIDKRNELKSQEKVAVGIS